VLEGRQLSVAGFSGVGTMGMANIIVVILFQEYSVYSRTIKERVHIPDRKGTRGQAVFRSWIYWGWALWAWLVLLLKYTLRNIIHILEPSDSSQIPPIERVLEGRQFFAVGFSGVGTISMARVIVDMHS
jgi:hypothetical protein